MITTAARHLAMQPDSVSGACLAVCAIFKNEGPYLLEWIAYHHAIGFDHFFLYDNDSTDGGAALIQASPLANLVTLTHWPRRPGQLPAYRNFIERYAGSCDWVAFIDVDEFILPLNDQTIRPSLRRLRAFSAVLPQWRVFGPSGWEQRPDGLVIENYTLRAPDNFPANHHVKSIARCADLLDITPNPHEFRLRGPVCDPLGRPVPNVAIQPARCHDGIVINHYQTRSRQEWLEKIARGSAVIEREGPKYPPQLLDHYQEVSTVEDHLIQAFIPRVKALLARGRTPAHDSADTSWAPQGPNARQRKDGMALVFRDTAGPDAPWRAALRGTVAGRVDPDFLRDRTGRLRAFPTAEAAMDACGRAIARRTDPECWMD